MTETDSRAVLLMLAFEQDRVLPADDAAWAGREARRQLGETAPPPKWLALRAQLGLQRLAEREPRLGAALRSAGRPPGATGPALLLLAALALGMFGESWGAGHQVNLLALPLLGLLAWNLAVYALLLVQALRRRQSAPRPALVAVLLKARGWLARRLRPAPASARAGLAHAAADWWALSAPLQVARGTALLHAGAAALALGAVLAMYGRGLVFDYQAGWDSTFLQPAQVQRLLGWLLGPASAISGLALPDADTLAGLRLASGGGEGAAPWIHRWAITLGVVVVLPRLLLALWAWARARRLALQLPLPDDEAIRRLLHEAADHGAPRRRLKLLPYSYQLDEARQSALGPAMAAWLGPALALELQPTLPLGAEDTLSDWLPAVLAPADAATAAQPPGLIVLLFAMTATPERESHGAVVAALLRALAALPAPRPKLQVAVDESGFRQRLAGADAAVRLAQRRAAWEALLRDHGVVPGFIDLSGGVAAAAEPTNAKRAEAA